MNDNYRKELDSLREEKSFYEIYADLYFNLLRSVFVVPLFVLLVGALIIFTMRANLSDTIKAAILTLLGGATLSLIKVFLAWKNPSEMFIKDLEKKKREKELRELIK